MMILYECEKVAVLQEDDKFIVHILDNYRMVKEIIVNRGNLISTLKKEVKCDKYPCEKVVFGKKKLTQLKKEVFEIEKVLNYI